MNFLDVKHLWVNVQISQGFNYQYPSPISAYMREHYGRAAVYRWMAWRPTTGISAFYVGETGNLARRIEQYRSPGPSQATNLRLKAYFDEAVGRGEQVEVQAFEFEPFQINKVPFAMDLLGHTHLRRMLENLVLVWFDASASTAPPVILNQVFRQDRERNRRRIDKATAELKKTGLTDEQITRVIQAALIQKTKG